MDERTQQLIAECKRQQESCEYTCTGIIEWLKCLRLLRLAFVVVPIVLGGLATWPLLAHVEEYQWVTGLFALLAGLTPAVYKALNLDVSLEALGKSEHQFRILRDRFRVAWCVTALGHYEDFKAEFDQLMDRMDSAREGSVAVPERFFNKGRAKIERGDYRFDVDQDRPLEKVRP
ncbi:hypothetical protein [Burkholderia ubonensis]|uniref:SLATT domain-containing protein n=1 Tax=Burkholderia ubonensis TaxID=101571 RepID=A0ABD4E7E1_9BURK|nr:hypothetical protein [Burkholderia ubonensis]KVN88826.1 hypothetical protein WJ68_04620 [Burkholderia ubonensis]